MKQSSFARIPFNPAKVPFFYGWWILVVGTIGVLMSTPGQTIGVSTFTDSLIEALGITRDQLSFAYMLGTITSSLLLTRAGKIYDRFGARPVAIGASILLAIGLIYLSQVDRIANSIGQFFSVAGYWVSFFAVLFGFLCIRFSGQGVMTLVARGMMMKWFDQRRGFALGFSNFFMSIGFSFAPLLFEFLIQGYGWRAAWQWMAMILLIGFPIFVFLFFRNDPTESGLQPDGKVRLKTQNKPARFPNFKSYSLRQVRLSFIFWIFATMVSMNGLFQTAFSFNVVSIFEEIGGTRAEAVGIFPYMAVTAGVFTLVLSPISDWIKVKYLLLLMGFAGAMTMLGFVFLGTSSIAYVWLILFNGLTISLYGIIGAVVWVRYYGKTHLGAILGQVMMLTVLFSALGPILFSKSLTLFGTYNMAAWLCFLLYSGLMIAGFWVKNPQEQFRTNSIEND